VAGQYVDKADVKAYLGLSGTSQDNNIDRSIDGACRLIDAYCQRRFWVDSTVQVKYFTPESTTFISVPDISTTTGLIVELDTSDNGTYDTTLVRDTDYYLLPVNPKINYVADGNTYLEPYTELRILETRSSERFEPLIVKNIKITAKWGWSAIPQAITQATIIQAVRLWKRKDTPFNVFGNEQIGTQELFTKFDPDAKELLKGYRRLNLTGQVL
jgi:hypothetical protein